MKEMYDFAILRQLRKRENLSIAEVSERSGISAAVISKLERNLSAAELETIYRLARVFGMNASDLLALAEARAAHKVTETGHDSDNFRFREVKYGNVRCLYGTAQAGSRVSRPKIHGDDYEICWLLEGELDFFLPGEKHNLKPGDAIQFDAMLEHTYEAVKDTKLIIIHLKKQKRF